MESKRTKIMPNDTVLHKPSGETWVVCGVNHEQGKLIPCFVSGAAPARRCF